MKQAIEHPWPVDEAGATVLQLRLAGLAEQAGRLGTVRTVAGVDVAYDKHSNKLVAAAVLDARSLDVVASASAQDVERFPYLPGLFSFRELPAIAAALQQLDVTRTQPGIKPVYVSVGHRISLATACHWILQLAPHFRLPETTRQADQYVKRLLSKD